MRLIFRFVLPGVIRKQFNKYQDFNQNYNQSHAQEEQEKGVKVDYVPENNPSQGNGVGDYIDFEELKE